MHQQKSFNAANMDGHYTMLGSNPLKTMPQPRLSHAKLGVIQLVYNIYISYFQLFPHSVVIAGAQLA